MGMQALLIFQIIADVVLCIAILFLLMRIGRNISQTRSPVVEEKYLAELGTLIQASRAEAEHFAQIIDESCIKCKDLAIHLEEKEAKLAARLHDVDRQLGNSPPPAGLPEQERGDKYGNISALLKTGMTVKEAAQQSGLTEGEVTLIFELEKKKTES